jgi:hypothetical protein
MKYRIVKRNTNGLGEISKYPWYYAQRNILGVWFDLRYHPLISTYNAFDRNLEVVELWLENHIWKITFGVRSKESPTQEVVKTYD